MLSLSKSNFNNTMALNPSYKLVDLTPCKVHDLIPKSTSSAPSHKHKHSMIHYSILVFRHINPSNPRASDQNPGM